MIAAVELVDESYSRMHRGALRINKRTEEIGERMLTSDTVENLQQFVRYAKSLDGDEKGEAQVFCDRLFRAFGH